MKQQSIVRADGQPFSWKYSDGRTQYDVIRDVIKAFNSGYQIVVLRGSCGTGKSVIGLMTALHYGGGIVVVPSIPLQEQYQRDYNERSGRIRIPGLSIGFITGRANHRCLLDSAKYCSNKNLPCTRRLEKGERRRDVCIAECPHWIAIAYDDYTEDDNYAAYFSHSESYVTLEGHTRYINYPREEPCRFYAQYRAYIDSKVVVLNSWIFKAELYIHRLPYRPILIVDEMDEFLDSLTLEVTFTDRKLRRLAREGESLVVSNRERVINTYAELENAYVELKRQRGLLRFDDDYVKEFMRRLIAYLTTVETDYTLKYLTRIKWLKELHSKYGSVVCYVDEEGKVHFFVPEPSVVWQEIRERLGDVKILMMSATTPSAKVLKEVYGIENFAFIEGERRMPGKLIVRREPSCIFRITHSTWQDEQFRERYTAAFDKVFSMAKRPLAVLTHAYKYIPQGYEVDSREAIKAFSDGESEHIITTYLRGVDFRHAKAVLIPKFPIPQITDPVLRVMRMKLGEERFWSYLHDLAFRTFKQQIGRVLRHEKQVVEFWSLDVKCYQMLRAIEVEKEVR